MCYRDQIVFGRKNQTKQNQLKKKHYGVSVPNKSRILDGGKDRQMS